jgi:hypothetical protein
MQPSTIDYQRPVVRPRRFRFVFTLCGIGCGLIATLFMAVDNLVLWSTAPSHPYFYPITHLVLGFGPLKAWVAGANSAHPSAALVFWIVLLGGPLLEWTSWGVIIDVIRAKVAAR